MYYYITNELYHHGVIGQKWYIRRYQPYPKGYTGSGREIGDAAKVKRPNSSEIINNLPRGARYNNLEKFGRSRKENVLYLTGASGTGKSTIAKRLSRTRDKIIHLDSYSEQVQDKKDHDKGFDDFINKKYPGVLDKVKFSSDKVNDPKYWKDVDQFNKAISEYSEKLYNSNARLIVEGKQIGDGWLAKTNSYDNKPIIVLRDSAQLSAKRAAIRDNAKDLSTRIQKNKEYELKMDDFTKDFKKRR